MTKQYSIIIAEIPYIEKENKKKIRPVVQLTGILDGHGNMQVAFITSKLNKLNGTNNVTIKETDLGFSKTGLKSSSFIIVSKIYTVMESQIIGHLGILPTAQSNELNRILKSNFDI
jgi:PemK-like, MazF-like toxin of type II toxin-antitoxin system